MSPPSLFCFRTPDLNPFNLFSLPKFHYFHRFGRFGLHSSFCQQGVSASFRRFLFPLLDLGLKTSSIPLPFFLFRSVASAAAATTAASTTVPNLGIQGYYEAIGFVPRPLVRSEPFLTQLIVLLFFSPSDAHFRGIYATPVFCSGSDYVVGTVTWPSWGIYNALSTVRPPRPFPTRSRLTDRCTFLHFHQSCNDQLGKCAAAGFSGCSSRSSLSFTPILILFPCRS